MPAYIPGSVLQLLPSVLEEWGLQLLDKQTWEITADEHAVRAALLGSGSFGYVFAARHNLDEQDYALKVVDMRKLREDRGMENNDKMIMEVKTLAKLRHGHYIARYFDAKEFTANVSESHGESSSSTLKDWLVIRLELCKGGTLHGELEKFKPNGFPTAHVRKYLTQLAEAFRFMAQEKFVHRDFKLDNVCLSAPSPAGDCRVVDLGFAREVEVGGDGPTSAGQSKGTLFAGRGNKLYRSPENDGDRMIDQKDDMWALGIVLCEMLTGETAAAVMDGDYARFYPRYMKELNEWKKRAAELDQNLGRIAEGLLRVDPRERYDAEMVLNELHVGRRLVSDKPPPFIPVGWLEKFLDVDVPATLADALQGVDCLKADKLDESMNFCRNMDAASKHGLTDDEAAAIRVYTGDCIYHALNKHLRNSAREDGLHSLQPVLKFARFLHAALMKLPDVGEKTVFRGVRVSQASLDIDYEHDTDFAWGQFTSCSLQSKSAMEFGTKTLFAVECFGGRRISSFSAYGDEDEVLLPIGTRLRVTGVIPSGEEKCTILLKELHSSGRTVMKEKALEAEAARRRLEEEARAAEEQRRDADAKRIRALEERLEQFMNRGAAREGAETAEAAEAVRKRSGSEDGVLSDEDILRLWCERCPALQELWPAGDEVTSWEGLTFGGEEDARRVVKIELEGKLGYAVDIPAELGGLTALRELSLGGNKLTSVPAELGGLGALTELNLSRNKLTSVPAELGGLGALTELNLKWNKLTSVPAELGGLGALTELNLTGNKLTSVPAELGGLGALTELNLTGNKLTSVPAELGGLGALTKLSLGFNELTSVPAELGGLGALTKLFLSANKLTSVPAELGGLGALTELFLSGNKLTSVPAELGGLGALTKLFLNENKLTSVPAEWEEGGKLEESGCSIHR